jgi:hypothetical protein
MARTKLEGFSRVAVLKFGTSRPYYFALYDDGTYYKIGDMVVVSGSSSPSVITDILTAEEAAEKTSLSITAEVIGRVDTTAYDRRVAMRKEKEALKKEMAKRRGEIQKKLDDEYYASKDPEYVEMLKRYEEMR